MLYANETTLPNNLENQEIQQKTTPSKSGFFLGIEGNLSGATIYQDATYFAESNSQLVDWCKTKDSFSFGGGLVLGYQHYFGESQAHGLSFQTMIGSGIPFELVSSDTFISSNIEVSFFFKSYSFKS